MSLISYCLWKGLFLNNFENTLTYQIFLSVKIFFLINVFDLADLIVNTKNNYRWNGKRERKDLQGKKK